MTTGVHQSEKKTKSKEKEKKRKSAGAAVLASWRCARERDLRPAGPVSAQFGPPPFFFSFFFFFLTVLKTVLVLGLQVANKNS
jgi:hypothetical protein